MSINNDCYFTTPIIGTHFLLSPVYSEGEYEQRYSQLKTRYPTVFCINLEAVITEFLTTVSPILDISVEAIIDMACFYYGDIDCARSVIDDIIDPKKKDAMIASLTMANYDRSAAMTLIDIHLALVEEAARNIIVAVETVLTKLESPAIINFGSCYRLENIGIDNTVYFVIRTPEQVYNELYGSDALPLGII